MITGIIYKYVNIKNNKVYIGQTYRDLQLRHKQHINCKRKTKLYFDTILQKDINNFKLEIVKEIKMFNKKLLIEELNNLERYYINKYNSLYPNGYNLSIGGFNNEPTIEIRKKISNNIKKTYENGRVGYFKGKKFSEEHKQKIREASKGRKWNEEMKKHFSIIRKGKIAHNKGKIAYNNGVNVIFLNENDIIPDGFVKGGLSFFTEETKNKIRIANKNKKYSVETIEKFRKCNSGKNNPNYGKHWYNNGTITITAFSCPEGFVKGKLNNKNKGGK